MWFGLTILCAAVAVLLFPFLAWREAQRQAFDATSDLTLAYAQDILHRADEGGVQAAEAAAALKQAGHLPCSAAEVAHMRRLDLRYSYLQAVGRAADGRILCSSMGESAFALGGARFVTRLGVAIYPDVALSGDEQSPLFAIERDGFVALIHRALPLATWTAIPEMSLGLFQLDRPAGSRPELSRGAVSRAWASGPRAPGEALVFSDARHLVAVVRSRSFRVAAVAAVPLAYVDARAQALAMRLVPAGIVAGLAVGAATLLLARRQRSLAADIRHALRQDEFFLEYQPIIELATGRCIGAEALLRWRRRSGERLPPDIFIPVAEQAGMITRLTERVVRLIERDAGEFLAKNPGFHVALNVSAEDLQSSAIIGLLERFLESTKAAPSNLTIEITERSFIDMRAACATISALRARGFEISIDDFGTGYSSLSYLESLELDILKIDRSFVEAVGTKAPTHEVVRHIIAMAGALRLRMVAEGVELPAQAEFLNRQGVQYAQGWLYGKPTTFAAVAERFGERDHAQDDSLTWVR